MVKSKTYISLVYAKEFATSGKTRTGIMHCPPFMRNVNSQFPLLIEHVATMLKQIDYPNLNLV